MLSPYCHRAEHLMHGRSPDSDKELGLSADTGKIVQRFGDSAEYETVSFYTC